MKTWSKTILAFGLCQQTQFVQGFHSSAHLKANKGFAIGPQNDVQQNIRLQSRGGASSRLSKSFSQSNTILNSASTAEKEFDTEAVVKYTVAATTEMSLYALAFHALDIVLEQFSLTGAIPAPAIGFLFYAIALKSRVFNPLNNQRPNLAKSTEETPSTGFRDRVMPSWTPPGVVFPIMWLLIIGPLRAYSSTLVVQANEGLFCTPATLALIFHVTCGDIWNTINNTEKRYGAAVVGVLTVWASAVFAATQYFAVDPLAGKCLGATVIWLTIASALITDTWRLNPSADGKKDPLYPTKETSAEGSITKFAWFSKEGAN